MILWELATHKEPYATLARQITKSNAILLFVVKSDNLRERIPTSVCKAYKRLIKLCWDKDPKKRPSVKQIEKILGGFRNYENKGLFSKVAARFTGQKKTDVLMREITAPLIPFYRNDPTSSLLNQKGVAPPHTIITTETQPPRLSTDFFEASFEDQGSVFCLNARNHKWGLRMSVPEGGAESAPQPRIIFFSSTYLVMKMGAFEWGVQIAQGLQQFFVVPGKKDLTIHVQPKDPSHTKVTCNTEQSQLRFIDSLGRLYVMQERRGNTSTRYDAGTCSMHITVTASALEQTVLTFSMMYDDEEGNISTKL